MKLIKRTSKKKIKSCREYYHGIFYCGYCDAEVEKTISNGYENKSCGCLHRQVRHGFSRTKIYKTWDGMRQRCVNPKHKAYKNYGGRGIQVCEEWRGSFLTFKNWAFDNGYEEGMEIDRKDNSAWYSPENCTFVTHAQNNRNKRTNKLNWVIVDAIRDLRRYYNMPHLDIKRILGIPPNRNISEIISMKTWIYKGTPDIINYPGKMQPSETFNKAYWDFTYIDWQCWIDSFKIFPVSEYAEHVKTIIDSYMPSGINIKYNKEGV